jgi:competence protein ComEA
MKTDKIKDFFSLPGSQKRGYFLLGIILLMAIIAPAFYKAFLFTPDTINLEHERQEIESFLSSIEFRAQTRKETTQNSYQNINLDQSEYTTAAAKLSPFSFNPNNLPAEKWLEMGFSQRQVQSIKKYEQKGGRFHTKADVKKMWAISPEEYEIIEPFIQLPDSMSGHQHYEKRKYEPKTYQIVELNSADTSMLKTLPGIGAAFASRIYQYRMKLGGYHTKSQIFEVRGMDTARFEGIEPYIDINPWLIRKININEADFDKFSNHPYISNNVAISLINYRNRHGNYLTTEDIMKSELVDQNLYLKLAPYLTVE